MEIKTKKNVILLFQRNEQGLNNFYVYQNAQTSSSYLSIYTYI